MKTPFRHTKHRNSSQFRKIFVCRDHDDCDHLFTIIEGLDDNKVLSHLCYESGIHSLNTTIGNLISAPSRGIHPTIKLKIDEWIREVNMKPAKILFSLENSDFVDTHVLPTLQQIRQYKADVIQSIGEDLSTLSSFREYMNAFKVC